MLLLPKPLYNHAADATEGPAIGVQLAAFYISVL